MLKPRPIHAPRPWPGVRALIRIGADPNLRIGGCRTPLHWAALGGAWPVLPDLLRAGADPNTHADDGNTPLHLAAGWGDTVPGRMLLALLLAGGADPQRRNNAGHAGLALAPTPKKPPS